MNKIINILLIVIISCVYLINSSEINLVVNPSGNSSYVPGQECGNSTVSPCNNIGDAIAYYNTIGLNQNLNLQLQDGVYSIIDNSMDLFDLNITISPFNQSSNNVIFEGYKQTVNSSLITIEPTKGTIESNQFTMVSISNITFNNFQSVLNVSTNSSTFNFSFNGCNFNNYSTYPNSNPPPLIAVNMFSTQLTKPKSVFNLTNCQIQDSDGYLNSMIMITNCDTHITNSIFNDIYSIGSLFSMYYSNVYVSNSQFTQIHSVSGCIQVYDSISILNNCTFINNVASYSGSAFSQTLSDVGLYYFYIENCQFINSTSMTGGAISAGNSNSVQYETFTSTILSSHFLSCSSQKGGAINLSNVKLLVANSNFTQNSASDQGSIFYGYHSIIDVENTILFYSFIAPVSPQPKGTVVGQIIYTDQTTATFNDCSFQSMANNEMYCGTGSLINVTNSVNLTYAFDCQSCNGLYLNDLLMCGPTGGFSSLTVSSSTTHHSTTGTANSITRSFTLSLFTFIIYIIIYSI